MAPRHTQGVWGGGISCDRASLLPNKPRTGVLAQFFPPPAYAGIHPTLYLFGFRANALNSHSPWSGLERFEGLLFGAFREKGGCGDLEILRGSGASGGLLGPPGASKILHKFLEPLEACLLGLVVGFASFWGSPYPWLADPEISAFPGHLQGSPGQWPPRAPSSRPQKLKVAGFRGTNNLVNHSKGERSPKQTCPSTWTCSSRSTNSLGLHSTSKQWCK